MIIGAIDEQGRCKHYHSAVDIVAIKHKCCGEWYACIHCHQEAANHAPAVWSRHEFEEKAIRCGNCKTELSITGYLNAPSHCPSCNAAFNPGCSNHYHFYFDISRPA
jgi:uncharacterized CHY-type Zn-finger protein